MWQNGQQVSGKIKKKSFSSLQIGVKEYFKA